MSATPDPSTEEDDSLGKQAAIVAAAIPVAVLDYILTDALLLWSLIVMVLGLATGEPVWMALGVVFGVAGIVLTWTGLAKQWEITRTWPIGLLVWIAGMGLCGLMWRG